MSRRGDRILDTMLGLPTETPTYVLIGAYGRDANLQDWEAGKDFKVLGGPYCSIRDLNNLRQEHHVVLMQLDGTEVLRVQKR